MATKGSNADPDEGWSLPAWTYHDPEFFRLECERVMRPSWQVVCHESDIAGVGFRRPCGPCPFPAHRVQIGRTLAMRQRKLFLAGFVAGRFRRHVGRCRVQRIRLGRKKSGEEK